MDEVVPQWAAAWMEREDIFQATVIEKLDTIDRSLCKLEQYVHDLQLGAVDTASSIRLAYCRPGMSAILVGNSDACQSLLACCDTCRNMSSSMMSVAEIVADYEVFKRGEGLVGQNGGDCQAAAAEACVFFSSSHRLMAPEVVSSVLYCTPGSQPVMGVDALARVLPAKDGALSPGMKAYKLDVGTCIWRPDPESPVVPMGEGGNAVTGYKHFVVCVKTLEGFCIAVDWGVRQFAAIPDGARLYF